MMNSVHFDIARIESAEIAKNLLKRLKTFHIKCYFCLNNS